MSNAESNQSKQLSDKEFVKRAIGFALIGYASIVAVGSGIALFSSDESAPSTSSETEYSTEYTPSTNSVSYDESGPPSPLIPVAFSLGMGAVGTYLAFPRSPQSHKKPHSYIEPAIRHLDFKTPNVQPFYDAD